MTKDLFSQLQNYAKEHVNEHRYKHIMGVVEAAEEYARIYGADIEKARIAGVFHDACKGEGALEHGPAAAIAIKEIFGVDDEDIINAIKYHTVGRANMSILEKVVKCADLTEKNRNYPTVESFRKRLKSGENIDAVLLDMMYECKDIILGRGDKFADTSVQCIEWLEQRLKGDLMDNKSIAMTVAQVLNDKKAKDISIIDIAEKSGFADYFVLATASNSRQLDALKYEVEDKLASMDVLVNHNEGVPETGWILMDFGDIIVNLFSEEQRNRYSLEKVWNDCEIIEPEFAE